MWHSALVKGKIWWELWKLGAGSFSTAGADCRADVAGLRAPKIPTHCHRPTTMTASITTKDDRELHKIYKPLIIVSKVLRINSITSFRSTKACIFAKETSPCICVQTVTFTWFQLWEQTLRWQNNWHADWTIAVKRDWTWSMRRAWGWPGASTWMVATTTWCIPPFLTDDLQREPGQRSRSWSTHWFCWESSLCRKINLINGGSG